MIQFSPMSWALVFITNFFIFTALSLKEEKKFFKEKILLKKYKKMW